MAKTKKKAFVAKPNSAPRSSAGSSLFTRLFGGYSGKPDANGTLQDIQTFKRAQS